MDRRPSWDSYFMKVAEDIATRSTCLRRQVGAVLVKDNRIIATGYNGAPDGMQHCLEIGCLREQQNIPSGKNIELCRAVHAEQNALMQAAKHGGSVNGAKLYVTTYPCVTCAKLLIQAGVNEIVYINAYPDYLSEEILAKSSVAVRKLE